MFKKKSDMFSCLLGLIWEKNAKWLFLKLVYQDGTHNNQTCVFMP